MIRAEQLSYSIGVFHLNVSFTVRDDEYAVLLGMTGSGKTLFLETLCGLRPPAGGCVRVDGQDVTCAEPRRRGIGYVPQDGALFEHLNVRRNIGFALEVSGAPKAERDAQVEHTARLLHIEHLLDRRIRGLSGGERQRVALGRALIAKPRALILDEPVSALDEYTREAVCRELKRIQRELKLSVIHVCHSFEEAKLVADRVSVMHEGAIIQTGAPAELYRCPASLPVARILRLNNIFTGVARRVSDSEAILRAGEVEISAGVAEGPTHFYIRPWEIALGVPEGGDQRKYNCLESKVSEILFTGATAELKTQGGLPVTFYLSPRELEKSGLKEGDTIRYCFPTSAVHFFKPSV